MTDTQKIPRDPVEDQRIAEEKIADGTTTPAPGGNAIDRIVEAAAAENEKAGTSIADEKIQRIVDEAAAETERGRAARRQP